MIACVAPSPSIDRLFEVDRLRPGAIHRPTRFVRVAGGKGLNAARAAAALGADVRAVALLGGPGGRWIADELNRIGVPLVAAACAGETRSCLSVADRESGSLTEFYEENADVSPEEWEAFERLALSAAESADWTTISGSLPPGAPADSYQRFAAAATHVAVDTAALGTARPALVKVNATEASTLTGITVGTTGEAMEAAHLLRRRIGGTDTRPRSPPVATEQFSSRPTEVHGEARSPQRAATRSGAATPSSPASSPRSTPATTGRTP